jgi:raffinose synthase
MWFGEFIHPDWDEFESGHEMGAFQGAGRAVSGGPVYASDKPDEQDFDVLRKLVLPDGSVLRACGVGRPTQDCLFHDVTKEDVLLKVFNVNTAGSGVIGVFNCRYGDATVEISGVVSPMDVDAPTFDQTAELYVIYAHNTCQLRLLKRAEAWSVTLATSGFEIFTIVPVVGGFAPIGLPDYYNSGGAVVDECQQTLANIKTFRVRGSGRFLAYSQSRPISITADGEMLSFIFEDQVGKLEFQLSANQIQILTIHY